MKRDQTRRGALFSPVADAANMARVVQADRGDPQLLRARDTLFHRLISGHLAEAGTGVKGQDRAGVFFQHRMLIKLQMALAERAHIAGDHADAVGVVSGQIRRHQMIRHQTRLVGFAAGVQPYRLHKLMQPRGIDSIEFTHFALLLFMGTPHPAAKKKRRQVMVSEDKMGHNAWPKTAG